MVAANGQAVPQRGQRAAGLRSGVAPVTTDRQAMQDLVYRSCSLLDDERYDDWLELLAPGFRYRITAYSPEIRKAMTWLDHDADELRSLFDNLPSHVRVLGTYRRQVGVFEEVSRDGNATGLRSSVVVYHTDLKGASRLFALARYHDTVTAVDGTHLLAAREVRLDTRQLDFGPHVII